MPNDTIDRRRLLARDLLKQLRDVCDHINKITEDLGDSSKSFLSRVYDDHSEKIQEKVNLFNKNVESVRNINIEITNTINEWYKFAKDEREMARWLFPVRFFLKRKQVISRVKELKQEITGVGIKNRIIREDIQHLESTLEYEAAQRLKKDVRYKDYLSHLKTKSMLLEELKYLLPTLHETPLKELHTDKLDEAIETLS